MHVYRHFLERAGPGQGVVGPVCRPAGVAGGQGVCSGLAR